MDSEPLEPPGGFRHVPVLLDRIVDLIRPVPDGWYVDCTLGGAGHARAVLEAHPGLRLLGIDRDDAALRAASAHLADLGDRVVLVRSGFDRLSTVLTDQGIRKVSAVLFDLGVSSHQFDEAERGFSYRHSAPLDMRMDRDQPLSAMEVVNDYPFARLERLIRTYGEERFSRRVAEAIVAARPVATTDRLADIIRDAIPAPARRKGGHPAKRTFQAIRIEVNRELEILGDALEAAVDSLQPGGRCVVMSYHSLEDRITKRAFRSAATGDCACPAALPCVCGAEPTVELVTRGALVADEAELAANPRSASVRVRAVERLPYEEAS